MRQKENHKLLSVFILLLLTMQILFIPSIKISLAETNIPRGYSNLPKSITLNTTWSWKWYMNYTEFTNFLKEFESNYSNLVDLFSIGKTYQNRSIWAIRLTNENIVYPNKTAILLVGEHHAREYISITVPLFIAYNLVQNYYKNKTIQTVLDYTEFYIIPSLNPDGYMEALTHNPWQRKNIHPIDDDGDGKVDEDCPEDVNGDGIIGLVYTERGWEYEGIDNDNDGKINEDWVGGVDLNRNYNFSWNYPPQGASNNPLDETYRGPAPFSELETQSFRNFISEKIINEGKNFTLAISYHSGTEAILYPWGYKEDPTPDNDTFIFIGNLLKNFTQYPLRQGYTLYPVSGEWGDWLYGTFNITSYTIEVYINRTEQGKLYSPPTKEIDGKPYVDLNITAYFNPSGSKNIKRICEKNLYAIVAAAILLLPPIPKENASLELLYLYGAVTAFAISMIVITIIIFRKRKII
ncbi:MAG: M14 family zinc carboxypeptidase [Candidatus Asgardarchaeia archaeon]